MELGYETVGKNFSDVTFENITVLHALHNAVISIHNANNADIKNITYKNITIEDAYSTTGTIIDIRVLFSETWSTNHATTSLGSVDGVNIQNVKVISAKQMCIDIGGWRDTRKGYESDHYVNNVAINGLSLAGKILSKEDCKINNYGYLNNFTISQSEQVTGAESPITQNNLSGYGNELEVNFIKNK
jgi:hypothetical protein